MGEWWTTTTTTTMENDEGRPIYFNKFENDETMQNIYVNKYGKANEKHVKFIEIGCYMENICNAQPNSLAMPITTLSLNYFLLIFLFAYKIRWNQIIMFSFSDSNTFRYMLYTNMYSVRTRVCLARGTKYCRILLLLLSKWKESVFLHHSIVYRYTWHMYHCTYHPNDYIQQCVFSFNRKIISLPTAIFQISIQWHRQIDIRSYTTLLLAVYFDSRLCADAERVRVFFFFSFS